MKLFTFLFIFIYVLTTNIGHRLGIDSKLVNYFLLIFSFLYILIKEKAGVLFHSTFGIVLYCAVITVIMRVSEGIMADSFQVLMNLLFPALIVFVIRLMKTTKNEMQGIIIKMFIVNSFVAIFEFILKSHLIGWYEAGYTEGYISYQDSAFRSVALLGGPLANAEITCMINAFVLFSNIKNKYKLFCLGTLAILAYNARTSFFMNAAIFVLYAISNFHNFSLKQRKMVLGAMILIAAFVGFLAFNTNMGSRLFMTDKTDGGSIDIRLQLFDYVMSLNFKDFLFGMSYTKFQILQEFIGVKVIENFWLNYIFHFGIVVTLIFTVAYFFVIREIFSEYKRTTELILVLGIIIIMSSTNGLYSDYRSFLMLLLCGYIFAPSKEGNIPKIDMYKVY